MSLQSFPPSPISAHYCSQGFYCSSSGCPGPPPLALSLHTTVTSASIVHLMDSWGHIPMLLSSSHYSQGFECSSGGCPSPQSPTQRSLCRLLYPGLQLFRTLVFIQWMPKATFPLASSLRATVANASIIHPVGARGHVLYHPYCRLLKPGIRLFIP